MRPLDFLIQTPTFRALAASLAVLAILAPAVQAQVRGDFDGDGFADLAIGAVTEDVRDPVADTLRHDAGAVNVLYGRRGGLSEVDDQFFTQNGFNIEDEAEDHDFFGAAVVSGDFNGDGYGDLAIGAPGETLGAREDVPGAGAVNVIYGTEDGLTWRDNQFWHQDVTGIEGDAEINDGFGRSLAAGDFNGDGYDDLAIGAPADSVGGFLAAGAVNVIYGSEDGLTQLGDQRWHQGSAGIPGDLGTGDEFGFSLTAADFNADGFDDLAIGAPGEVVRRDAAAGGVNVIYGGWPGLTAVGAQLWHQDSFEIRANDVYHIQGSAEENDRFGYSVEAGDFNGDGFADLAVGVINDDVGRILQAGGVNVIYGFHEGLIAENNRFWHQNITRVLERSQSGDRFGSALVSADFDGDDYDDLAVGAAGEEIAGVTGAGAVNVLYGRPAGLVDDGNQVWHQNVPGIRDGVERWNQFGHALAAGDFDGDGLDDLAIGIFNETLGQDVFGAGAINVLMGFRGVGLRTREAQFLHQNTAGVRDRIDLFDRFGFSLGSN